MIGGRKHNSVGFVLLFCYVGSLFFRLLWSLMEFADVILLPTVVFGRIMRVAPSTVRGNCPLRFGGNRRHIGWFRYVNGFGADSFCLRPDLPCIICCGRGFVVRLRQLYPQMRQYFQQVECVGSAPLSFGVSVVSISSRLRARSNALQSFPSFCRISREAFCTDTS